MIFGQDFNQMGGTTSGPQQPKARGLTRLWEIFLDNLGRFAVTNLLCVLSALPGAVGMSLGVMEGGQPIWLLLSGILGGALYGTCYGAMMDGILHALRDSTSGWWRQYCHAWRRDWKDNLLPGAIMGTLIALVIHVLNQLQNGQTLPPAMLFSTIFAAVAALALFTYLWPQRVFLDLGIVPLFRNSLLMILYHPIKSVLSVLVQAVYWGLLIFMIPYSTMLLLVLGVWFPALVGTMIVYQPLNHDLKIEERLGLAPEEEEEEEPEDEEDGGEME